MATKQPSPMFLTVILVLVVVVGMSFDSVAPFALGVLILILLGLLLLGYGNIHQVFVSLGIASPTGGRVVGGSY